MADAKQEPEIRTALIVVDMQEDFLTPVPPLLQTFLLHPNPSPFHSFMKGGTRGFDDIDILRMID
jgi:hypothetical protein